MKRCNEHVFVIAILALGWAFWLQRMGLNDHDAGVSNELLFARAPVMTILCCNPWPDQSPLYFLVLHVARLVSESPFAIQFLNALVLTASLGATYALARTFSRSVSGARGALLLGVVSPASLWLVRSGRMYPIQLLLSVLGFVYLLGYLKHRRPIDLIALSSLCILNVYNHFVGFLVTAVLFLPVFFEALREPRRRARHAGHASEAREPLFGAALAGLAILIAVLPQIFRLAHLVGGGVPLRPGLSLHGLSAVFLERVTWFWFINSNWGLLSAGAAALTFVYLGGIGALALGGLVLARRRMAWIAGLSIALPVVALGLAAVRMDVRDRYFLWMLPILWVTIANGAAGRLSPAWPAEAVRDVIRGLRAALFLSVILGSAWLLSNKLPERYGQWTKLMVGLRQIYRPTMVVYMPPGPPTGTPRWIAGELNMPTGLREIRDLTAQTRPQFLDEVRQTRDFIFLLDRTYGNGETTWRTGYLQERGYLQTRLSVFGVDAEIFTRHEVDGFARVTRMAPNASMESIVAWVRRRLVETRRKPKGGPALADAVVARIAGDGAIREGQLFMSQHGESGSWRLGAIDWDVVEEIRTASGGVDRDVILAHPETGSVLAVAFPGFDMNATLHLLYGIADSGLRFRSGADVGLAVYVDGVKKADTLCPNTPGWKELALDTTALRGKVADVVLLITTADDRSRHFAFQVAPSSRMPSAAALAPMAAPGDVILSGGRTLSRSLDGLAVYRVAGTLTQRAWRDPLAYSASDMHEAAGPDGEGTVRGRWALGPMLWDAVGLTRQRSGGVSRDGLWAHPRDGTTLVIDAPRTVIGTVLHGYVGLTDFSVGWAARDRVAAPVQFRISLDGRFVFEKDVARAPGWIAFDVAIPEGARGRSLRIEIASATDKWAHFVFDVWSD